MLCIFLFFGLDEQFWAQIPLFWLTFVSWLNSFELLSSLLLYISCVARYLVCFCKKKKVHMFAFKNLLSELLLGCSRTVDPSGLEIVLFLFLRSWHSCVPLLNFVWSLNENFTCLRCCWMFEEDTNKFVFLSECWLPHTNCREASTSRGSCQVIQRPFFRLVTQRGSKQWQSQSCRQQSLPLITARSAYMWSLSMIVL